MITACDISYAVIVTYRFLTSEPYYFACCVTWLKSIAFVFGCVYRVMSVLMLKRRQYHMGVLVWVPPRTVKLSLRVKMVGFYFFVNYLKWINSVISWGYLPYSTLKAWIWSHMSLLYMTIFAWSQGQAADVILSHTHRLYVYKFNSHPMEAFVRI